MLRRLVSSSDPSSSQFGINSTLRHYNVSHRLGDADSPEPLRSLCFLQSQVFFQLGKNFSQMNPMLNAPFINFYVPRMKNTASALSSSGQVKSTLASPRPNSNFKARKERVQSGRRSGSDAGRQTHGLHFTTRVSEWTDLQL